MSLNSLLNKFNKVLTIPHRTMKRKYNWDNEGIQYPGFKYYPRNPETFKDPPYEPSKLFMVQRIKPFKGNPYWDKDILKALRLDGKSSDIAIVKNIPENNARLWRIKHLVKITPITFPDGVPTEADAGSTYLTENGELRIKKKLVPSEESLQATESFISDKKKMDSDTLRKQSRKQWLNGWDIVM